MSNPPPVDPLIVATHGALFELWFPLSELPIPPAAKPDIAAIAGQVSAGMLQAFAASPLMDILKGMTYPAGLPFYAWLAKARKYKLIEAFLSATGGFGRLAPDLRAPLFSFFFEGSGEGPGSSGAQAAMFASLLREAYLSGIWDLPLAAPLTAIEVPPVFMSEPNIYSAFNSPELPPSRLYYDPQSNSIKHKDGPIDCLVIGSGPGGATVAQQLWEAGKRVVLIEKGPWVVWGSMDTRSYSALMFRGDTGATAGNGIIIRSGETMGGGSTVNIDLAFSPLEATIQARIEKWKADGLIDARFYTLENMAAAYEWVRDAIETRQLSQNELNQDNLVLWNGASRLGVDPKLYHLNRYRVGYSPSAVDDKRDAAKQLLLPAAQASKNPLSLIPDAAVTEVLFETPSGGQDLRAIGVAVTMNPPWTAYGNTIVDPCNLKIPPGTAVRVLADNVVLAGGTIGTTKILLNTAKTTPALQKLPIGKGLILHPSLPMVGAFDRQINLLEGLDSATFVDAFGVTPGFIYETMGGLPAYGAVLVPGSGRQVYDVLSRFNTSAGFGVMLVDNPYPENCITLDDNGEVVLNYALSQNDKERFCQGVAMGIRMMFLAGAKTVIIPTNENVLGLDGFDPMHGVFLTKIEQADLVERNLKFIPNRTVLTSAHLQATNKIGPSPDIAVVSTRQRVWNGITGGEVPNLYIMDSSIFPTSVGANPMQSLYTFAKIFAARFLNGMDKDPAPPTHLVASARARMTADIDRPVALPG